MNKATHFTNFTLNFTSTNNEVNTNTLLFSIFIKVLFHAKIAQDFNCFVNITKVEPSMLRVSSNDSVQVFHGIGALRGGLEVISWKGHHLTSFLFGGGIIHPWKRHHKKINQNKISFFFTLCFSHSPFVMDHNLHKVAYMK